jgi:hypothetical protein
MAACIVPFCMKTIAASPLASMAILGTVTGITLTAAAVTSIASPTGVLHAHVVASKRE